MPVFAVKSARTALKASSSLPPHRDRTLIEPLAPGATLSAAPLAGALAAGPPLAGGNVLPLGPQATATSAAARNSAEIRKDLVIDKLLDRRASTRRSGGSVAWREWLYNTKPSAVSSPARTARPVLRFGSKLPACQRVATGSSAVARPMGRVDRKGRWQVAILREPRVRSN